MQFKVTEQAKIMVMKKRLLTTLLFAAVLFATSARERMDTISYMTGLQVSYDIENNILPQLRLDYGVITKTIEKLFASEKQIKVEGTVISPQNLMEVGSKYLNKDIQVKVKAAMNDTTGKTEVFPDPKEKNIVSALIGADFAYKMAKAPYKVEKASFMKALDDNHNKKAKFTREESMRYMNMYYSTVIPENNRKESEKWLAETGKKKGVMKTASGILYRIEVEGDMNIKANKDEDVIKVLYTGTTIDGKVFDSNRWSDMSKERQELIKNHNPENAGKDNPIEFPLNRVIKGWTEGMKLIGKGGKITLWIPSELAYGERGAGNDIGPNQALRFDVELLEVTAK